MEKPWYRKLFSRPRNVTPKVTPPPTNYEDAEVQFGMGLKFANAAGAAQDFVQAAEWYRKAADQRHSTAQFNLGVMYAQGQGMAKDDAQSVIWFGKAAQQGDAGAQFRMGKNCHRASFSRVTQDATESRIEAYKWYQLAATQGYRGSEAACATLISNMSREDIVAAGQRAARFEAA